MPKKARTYTFNMRLSQLEKRWLEEAAQALGVSAGAFLRMHIRKTHKADKAKETT